jgi:hypothetical protein
VNWFDLLPITIGVESKVLLLFDTEVRGGHVQQFTGHQSALWVSGWVGGGGRGVEGEGGGSRKEGREGDGREGVKGKGKENGKEEGR